MSWKVENDSENDSDYVEPWLAHFDKYRLIPKLTKFFVEKYTSTLLLFWTEN